MSTSRSWALVRAKGSSGTKVSESTLMSFDAHVMPKADTMAALRKANCEMQISGDATRKATSHKATVHKATVHKVIDL